MYGCKLPAMPSVIQIPVEAYLDGSFDFEPGAEFIDGDIEERPMGEFDHSTWQQAIERWFLLHATEWNIRVRCELRVQTSATRYRIPDVVVFRRDNPIEQTLTIPPVAVFEILSPEDRMSRMLVKLADYESMGIGTIRVIDPKTRVIYRYEHDRLEPVEFAVEDLKGLPAASIDWKALESLLDC